MKKSIVLLVFATEMHLLLQGSCSQHQTIVCTIFCLRSHVAHRAVTVPLRWTLHLWKLTLLALQGKSNPSIPENHSSPG